MAKLPALIRTARHVERRIHTVMAESRAKNTSRNGRLGMSQLGKCERNLWAGLQGIPEDHEMDPRILVLFEHGNAVEDHVIRLLKRAGFLVQETDPDTGQQWRLSAFNDRLVGHMDGKIRTNPVSTEWALLEIKSANEKNFDELITVGYEAWNPQYAAQLQIYMGYSHLSDSLVVVYAKATSRIYAEKIRFDPAKFGALVEKAERILKHSAVKPIDRPAEGKSQYCGYCKWCDRNQWCWSPLAEVQFDD